MWAAIKAIAIACAEFSKSLAPLILKIATLLANGIQLIVDFFVIKTLYLREQREEERRLRKVVAERQELKEKASIKAFNLIVEEGWKIRYQDIVNFIKNNEFEKVIKLTDKLDVPEVNDILFDETVAKDPEYKAMKIVLMMRGEELKKRSAP